MKDVKCDDIICQYDNSELINKGGQRIVYKIDHPKYGKVALKIGNYRSASNQEGWDIERIDREIDILKKIDSPYYPKNYEFVKYPDGRYIILEEFVDSVPLTKTMDKFYSPYEALLLTKELIVGLKIIWEKNIVHRDLKPDNILITPDKSPKIIDLGIARSLDNTTITRFPLAGPCTPNYAAPELLHYEKKRIDPRTDQYNVGIILVQLLSKGIHPFDPAIVGGQSIPYNILNNNWNLSIFKEPQFSPIQPIAKKMLGFQQFQRYRSPEKLLSDIDSCLGEFV